MRLFKNIADCGGCTFLHASVEGDRLRGGKSRTMNVGPEGTDDDDK